MCVCVCVCEHAALLTSNSHFVTRRCHSGEEHKGLSTRAAQCCGGCWVRNTLHYAVLICTGATILLACVCVCVCVFGSGLGALLMQTVGIRPLISFIG